MSDEHDSTDPTTPHDGKASKRDRFKDALNRTKTQIKKFQEDREVKKHGEEEKKQESFQLSDDVNDFLAAGRVSTTSSRPSIGSITTPEGGISQLQANDALPSMQQPQAQSPRRKPVPRINVAVSSRFPGAKGIVQGPFGNTGLQSGGADGTTHLNAEFKPRSQSTSSYGISEERRARIRGLSVGFVDTSPVVIGEGGDECDLPVTEITNARERARSLSPMGRKPFAGSNTRQSSFSRPVNDNLDSFIPRPISRTQTGFSSLSEASLLPGSAQGAPVQPFSLPSHEASIPSVPPSLAHVPTGNFSLTREFEMTLGLSPDTPPASADLARSIPVEKVQPSILSPKPRHPPPSYSVIESGGQSTVPTPKQPLVVQPPQPPPQQPGTQQSRFRDSEQHALPANTMASRSQPSPNQQAQQQLLLPHDQYQPHYVSPLQSDPQISQQESQSRLRFSKSQSLRDPVPTYVPRRSPQDFPEMSLDARPSSRESSQHHLRPSSRDQQLTDFGSSSSDGRVDIQNLAPLQTRNLDAGSNLYTDATLELQNPPLRQPPNQLRHKDRTIPTRTLGTEASDMQERFQQQNNGNTSRTTGYATDGARSAPAGGGKAMKFYESIDNPNVDRAPQGYI